MSEDNIKLDAEKIELIENYSQLDNLMLSGNNLKVIPPLFLKFENLLSLDISNNGITKIENFQNLLNLNFLNISKNQIKNIGTSLAHMKKLKSLDISSNSIWINDSLIRLLTCNKELTSLSMKGNQDYDFDKLKYKCLDMLENLEVLDDVKIYTKNNTKNLLKLDFKIKTSRGEKKNVKYIKDYIKVKRNDMKYINDTEESFKIKSQSMSSKKFMATTYYYTNKFNF